MLLRYVTISFLIMIAACERNDNSIPPGVISSSWVGDEFVHMSLFASSEENTTTVSVFLHRHRADGITQFLQLTGDDELTIHSGEWLGEFAHELLPSEEDPWQILYEDAFPSTEPGLPIDIQFIREGSNLLSAQLVLMESSEFTLVADAEDVTLDSILLAEWVAIADTDYTLVFDFSCESIQGRPVELRRVIQGSDDDPLLSPFEFDLAQIGHPPAGSDNCQVVGTLMAAQNQSQMQAVVEDSLNVSIRRIERVEFPIHQGG